MKITNDYTHLDGKTYDTCRFIGGAHDGEWHRVETGRNIWQLLDKPKQSFVEQFPDPTKAPPLEATTVTHTVYREAFWYHNRDMRTRVFVWVEWVESVAFLHMLNTWYPAGDFSAISYHMQPNQITKFAQQFAKLHELVDLARQDGNAFANEYMLGMANGLILALSVMRDLPGSVPYLSKPSKGWLHDRKVDGPDVSSVMDTVNRVRNEQPWERGGK